MSLLLLAVLAASAGSLAQTPLEEADTILVELTLAPGHADVAVRYPASGMALPVVSLPAWAGLEFNSAVMGLTGETSDGEPLRVRDLGGGDWEVPAAGGGFVLRYRVESDKRSFTDGGGQAAYRPTLTGDLVVLWGVSWFVRPLDARLALRPVRLTIRGEYPDPAVLGGSASVFTDTESLARSFVLAGALRRTSADVLGQPVRLLAYGDDWRFDDQDLLEAAESVVRVQAEAMGFLPGDTLSVVLLEGSGRDSGGLAESGAIVLFPDPDLRLRERDPETLRLLAHEHFHRWSGDHAYSSPYRGEGRFKWFHEGVTEYLAFRTLARAGLLESGDFVFKVNQYIDRYLQNPVAGTATADAMEYDYWLDPDYQSLAYEKGFLLAMAIDARIQAVTGRRASIWDFARRVVGEGGVREYDDGTLLQALADTSGENWSEFYEAYMLGAGPLDLGAVCQDAGLDCRRDRGGPLRVHPTNRSRRSIDLLIR